MGNAIQDLVLKIGGDSTGGQQAVRDLSNALANTLSKALQDTGTKAEESSHKVSGFQRYLDDLKPSTDNAHASFTSLHRTLTEMWENPTAGVQKFAGAIGTDLSGALATAGGGLGATALVAGGVAGAFAVAGAAAFELAKRSAEVGAQLDDLHDATGMSVEALSRLRNAAMVLGVDVKSLSDLVFKMQQRMGESPEAFAKGLERIGLDFEEFKRLAPEEQLNALSTALQKTTDYAERNAAGTALMGKGFRDLAPTLYDLNKALDLTKDITPWTGEQAAQAEEFDMHLKSISVHFSAIADSLGRMALPPVLGMLNLLLKWGESQSMQMLVQVATLLGPGAAGFTAPEFSANTIRPMASHGPTERPVGQIIGTTDQEMFKLMEGFEQEQQRERLKRIEELKKAKAEALKAEFDDEQKAQDIALDLEIHLHEQVMKLSAKQAEADKKARDQINEGRNKAVVESLTDIERMQHAQEDADLSVADAQVRAIERRREAQLRAVEESLLLEGHLKDERIQLIKETAEQEISSIRYAQESVVAMLARISAEADRAPLTGQVNGLAQAFGTVNSAMAPLANLSPTFGLLHTAINGVTSGLQGAARASADMAKNGMNADNLSSLAAGYFGMAVAVYQYTAALIDARRAANAAEDSLFFAKQIGKDFGADQFSSALAKKIENETTVIAAIHGLSGRNYGEALNLSAIIEELGGISHLTAAQLGEVKARVEDLFTIIAKGGRVGVVATKELDTVFGQLADRLLATGGVADDFFLDLIRHAQESGIALESVTKFLKAEAAVIATGLSDLLTQPMIAANTAVKKTVDEAQSALDTLKASGKATPEQLAKAQDVLTTALAVQHGEAVRNKQALEDLGLTAVLAFRAAIASGDDWVTALQKISPQLATIQQAYKDLGLDIEDASIKGLVLENTILNGPGGTGKAISGLHSIFTAAQNIPGLMTPEMFAAQQRTLSSVYAQTQGATANAGGSTINALAPFQQTLHQMEDWAKKNGQELDARTRQMIDQSKELGIWNDDFKTDAEKTRESTKELIQSNENLIEALGGLPAALLAAMNGRPNAPTTSGSSGFLAGDDPTGGLSHPLIPVSFASEAFVRRPTLAMVGDAPGGEFVLQPSTIAAWMRQQALAAVLNQPSGSPFTGRAGASLAAAGGGTTTENNITVHASFDVKAYDARGVQQAVEEEIGPRLVELIEDGYRGWSGRLARNAQRIGVT